jgi:hypothetical protein
MDHCSSFLRLVLAVLIATACCSGSLAQNASSRSNVAAAKTALGGIDQIMNAAIARGAIPGGVVLVGHDGHVVYRKAFGMRSLEPDKEAMTVDTIFDLASVTKCVATATSVMKLVQEGKVRLNDPVAAYLPDFANNEKKDITTQRFDGADSKGIRQQAGMGLVLRAGTAVCCFNKTCTLLDRNRMTHESQGGRATALLCRPAASRDHTPGGARLPLS